MSVPYPVFRFGRVCVDFSGKQVTYFLVVRFVLLTKKEATRTDRNETSGALASRRRFTRANRAGMNGFGQVPAQETNTRFPRSEREETASSHFGDGDSTT